MSRRDDASEDRGGPYITAALFCQVVTRMPDGEWSAAGIHQGSVGTGAPGTYAEPVLFVSLAGGKRRGPFRVEVIALLPNGQRSRVIEPESLSFAHPGAGHTLTGRIKVPADQEGVIWFDVMVDGRFLTRTPFQIQHEPTS